MEINPKEKIGITQSQAHKKPQIYQTGIKGENIEINADNVYIINNNYNEPVYNYNNNRNNYYHSGYISNLFGDGFGYFQPYFFYLWCYSFPFVPWNVFLIPYLWGW